MRPPKTELVTASSALDFITFRESAGRRLRDYGSAGDGTAKWLPRLCWLERNGCHSLSYCIKKSSGYEAMICRANSARPVFTLGEESV